MNKKDHIDSVYEIDPVKVSDPVTAKALKDVAPAKHDVMYYAVPKSGFLHAAIQTVLRTLAGENKAGKAVNMAEHIVTHYIPAGGWIQKILDLIGNELKSKQTQHTMAQTKKLKLFQQIKEALKSPEAHAAIGFVVMIVAYFFHYDITTSQVTGDLTEVISALGAVYTAVFHVITLFHKQKSNS
jgi:hypothetical protein